ncbi:uncharacterized protein LOC124646242 [Helicoverpa zea]|uniref:uncharacterized protein LOC124646242 n=1 Tax=Helicoverpa zea TaxID=7113 RepID=UPI001F566898|nr:uncharacterized protein LOC124646242 [Helicoverpa zea]
MLLIIKLKDIVNFSLKTLTKLLYDTNTGAEEIKMIIINTNNVHRLCERKLIMLTRAARLRARLPPPGSLLSSASPPPDPGPPVIPAAAAASSSSDEYFSPPTSPPPVRRQGRRRPPTGLGSGDHQVPSRVPATGGCVQRMRWTQKMNENVMRAYYGSTEGGTNLTAYRDRMLSLFQVLEPAVNVSAQRLSDQVRVIQRNHRLDDAALDRLRLEMLSSPMVTTSSQAAVPPPPSGGVTPRSNLVERDEDNRVVTSDQRWVYRTWERPEQYVMDGSTQFGTLQRQTSKNEEYLWMM